MNHPVVLIAVNILALAFVAAFAWWYGKRISRTIPLGGGSTPAETDLAARQPECAVCGDPLFNPSQRECDECIGELAEQIEATGYYGETMR